MKLAVASDVYSGLVWVRGHFVFLILLGKVIKVVTGWWSEAAPLADRQTRTSPKQQAFLPAGPRTRSSIAPYSWPDGVSISTYLTPLKPRIQDF